MTSTPSKEAMAINDDIFAYDNGGMKQCISGFGRNAKHDVRNILRSYGDMDESEQRDSEDSVCYYIDELVRWCRALNSKEQSLRSDLAAAENKLAIAVQVANEAWIAWDDDNDHQVGKLLKALAGHSDGYRSDIDSIHAAALASKNGANDE